MIRPLIRALLLTLVCVSTAKAMPMLSADGTLLSHLEVAGYGSYSVQFGDAIVGDVFGDVTFDPARRAEANAVSIALAAALAALATPTDSIEGCEGIACSIFIPNQIWEPNFSPRPPDTFFRDEQRVFRFPWEFGDEWVSPGPGAAASLTLSDLADTSLDPTVTIGVYMRQAPVPTPASISLVLVAMGMLILRGSHRRRLV